MNVKVSIPVSLGGYTGQRDEWNEVVRDWNVSHDPDTDLVTLESQGSLGSKVKFTWDELQAALNFIAAHSEPKPPKQNYSKCDHPRTEVRKRTLTDDSYSQWQEDDELCLDCGAWVG